MKSGYSLIRFVKYIVTEPKKVRHVDEISSVKKSVNNENVSSGRVAAKQMMGTMASLCIY